MLVSTFKLTRKKAVLAVIAAALILAGIVILAGTLTEGADSRIKAGIGLKTDEDRAAYLSELGWNVDPEPLDVRTVLIPREFDDVYAQYNDLQKAQGFDLSEYCGMELDVYSYRVTNYSGCSDEVIAVLYLFNGQVVGGDIHSVMLDGFIHGLKTE